MLGQKRRKNCKTYDTYARLPQRFRFVRLEQRFVSLHQKRKIRPTSRSTISQSARLRGCAVLTDRIRRVWGPSSEGLCRWTMLLSRGMVRRSLVFCGYERTSRFANYGPGIGSICSRATARGDRLRNHRDNEIHKIHRLSRFCRKFFLFPVPISLPPNPLLVFFSRLLPNFQRIDKQIDKTDEKPLIIIYQTIKSNQASRLR